MCQPCSWCRRARSGRENNGSEDVSTNSPCNVGSVTPWVLRSSAVRPGAVGAPQAPLIGWFSWGSIFQAASLSVSQWPPVRLEGWNGFVISLTIVDRGSGEDSWLSTSKGKEREKQTHETGFQKTFWGTLHRGRLSPLFRKDGILASELEPIPAFHLYACIPGQFQTSIYPFSLLILLP